MAQARRSVLPPKPVNIPASFLQGVLATVREFLEPYLPMFHRADMALTAWLYLQGLMSNLPRKSAEPIAELHDLDRKVLQRFVGCSPWDDQKVRRKMIEDVAQTLGDPTGVLCLDPSAFPKKGVKSVGVKRQWCGRLGKKENCQVGVFGSYASPRGRCLVGTQLYLPREWCEDKARRKECYVPKDRRYRKRWELALEVLAGISGIPHACVLADAEFGRCGEFRDHLAEAGEHYALDIPLSLNVRILKSGSGPTDVTQAGKWMKALPKGAWTRVKTRDGSQGDRIFEACWAKVTTERKDGTCRKETLLAIRPIETPKDVRLLLAHLPEGTSLVEMVQFGTRRWTIEDSLERAKTECGMAQYEVRSWIGWHHHMTMAMLATWLMEKLRLSKEESQAPKKTFPPSDVSTLRTHASRAHFQPRGRSSSPGKKDLKEVDAESTSCPLPQEKTETLLSGSGG